MKPNSVTELTNRASLAGDPFTAFQSAASQFLQPLMELSSAATRRVVMDGGLSSELTSGSIGHLRHRRRSLRVQPKGDLQPVYSCIPGGPYSPGNCNPGVVGYYGLVNDTKTGETVRILVAACMSGLKNHPDASEL